MAGRSCSETVLRDRAGTPVSVTGTALDVNATLGVTTVPNGDASIIESTVAIPTGAATLVAAANANRRFIQINWNAGTANGVCWLGLTNAVAILTAYFQEMLDGGSFWLDNNVIVGSTFYVFTNDVAGGSVGVLEY